MYRLFLITFLGLLVSATALSDVQEQCIKDNSEPLSNDVLVGSWYIMYRFSLWGAFPPSPSCVENRFTKPTAEVIADYKAKYNDPNLPYSLDDNPVIRNDSFWVGMVTGNNVAKFYVLDPTEAAVINGGYAVTVYKPLSDKYIMWYDCSLRRNMIQLLSNDRHAPVAEMEEIIKNTPELNRLEGQRFCATY